VRLQRGAPGMRLPLSAAAEVLPLRGTRESRQVRMKELCRRGLRAPADTVGGVFEVVARGVPLGWDRT